MNSSRRERFSSEMKLILIVFALIVLIQYSESRHTGWFPQNLVDAFTNRTSEITNYVRSKGRSLKQFYVKNVRNKITSYLGFNNQTQIEDDHNNQARIKRKFKEYVEGAQANDEKIFDAIAPEKLEYSCNDNDPSIYMTTPQLIALHGYVSESHTIVTEDGYILTVHRIPHSRNSKSQEIPRKTVLLHHGLLGSSADWIIAGPEKGLAYILSEAGYDVWLANVRGNTYSRAHVTLNTDTFAFWNFTFHEVSQHDLPAVIDYIMATKGWDTKINYIGHSMGTTILFALLSTKTHYNKVLRAGFALAPVAFMSDIKSPIRLLAKYSNNLEYLLKLLGANQFLPQNSVLRWLSKHACEINHYEEVICENSLFVLCGHDERQFNKSLLPIILGHVPAGASTKTLVHYAQEIRNVGRFQQFDYGTDENLKRYGTLSPPEYPLHKITLPIALFSSENDWLASDVDVTSLYVQLVNPIEHYIVPLKEFNHIDFIWAVDAPKLVYVKLLQLLEEGVSKSFFNINLNTYDVR
ncbi:gastric triacylglycerol lipase-like [Nymphalis io]|uniref:gastric triacylglycerol lipase-like n=1 Tax=Inachis io TaxID=171585 RepID=UPI00216AA123|nr:gastric triacylglycerol lipase-like [Nymphalis io]